MKKNQTKIWTLSFFQIRRENSYNLCVDELAMHKIILLIRRYNIFFLFYFFLISIFFNDFIRYWFLK